MKQKLTIRAFEFEIDDDFLGMGVIKAVDSETSDNTLIAFESYPDGELELRSYPDNSKWNVEREVEKPETVELKPVFGKRVVVTAEDAEESENVGIGVAVDMYSGEMTWAHLPADELINAIKAVKGLD